MCILIWSLPLHTNTVPGFMEIPWRDMANNQVGYPILKWCLSLRVALFFFPSTRIVSCNISILKLFHLSTAVFWIVFPVMAVLFCWFRTALLFQIFEFIAMSDGMYEGNSPITMAMSKKSFFKWKSFTKKKSKPKQVSQRITDNPEAFMTTVSNWVNRKVKP